MARSGFCSCLAHHAIKGALAAALRLVWGHRVLRAAPVSVWPASQEGSVIAVA